MIPMYYREDIGDRWIEEDSDRLHAWGYLRSEAGAAAAGTGAWYTPAGPVAQRLEQGTHRKGASGDESRRERDEFRETAASGGRRQS